MNFASYLFVTGWYQLPGEDGLAGEAWNRIVAALPEALLGRSQLVFIYILKDVAIYLETAIIVRFWVWNHKGAGVYAFNCALMAAYGNKAYDQNTIAGPKTCS